MIRNTYELLRRFKTSFFEKRNVKQFTSHLNLERKLPKLTRQEKEAIKALYKKYSIPLNPDYRNYRLLYHVNGMFSEKYISNDLFRSIIEPRLNSRKFKFAWADKNMADKIIPKEFTARTILHNMNGQYYDHLYNPISIETAFGILEKERDYVIKKAIETASGKGVFHITNADEMRKAIDLMKGSDFIVQERINQHPQLKFFNETSVNIVRVITLCLADRSPVVLSGTLRVGAKGYFTDNFIDEKYRGMTVVGVKHNGQLMDKAYFASGERNREFEKLIAEKEIPDYSKMCELVIKLHKSLPYFGIVGWDVTIDDHSNIKILEYNINAIGILYYQYAHGALFGDYTEDVLKQVFID